VQHRAVSQPIDKLVAIARLKNLVKRVVVAQLGAAGGDAEQMKIMVTQNAYSALAQISNEAQRRERIGSAVHEIADQPESVAIEIEWERVEQRLQRPEAALNIADHVGGHYARKM